MGVRDGGLEFPIEIKREFTVAIERDEEGNVRPTFHRTMDILVG